MTLCDGKTLKPEHLPPRIADHEPQCRSVTFKIGTSLNKVEKTMVVKTLETTNNDRQKATKLLGISRRSIYNKLHKHDLM